MSVPQSSLADIDARPASRAFRSAAAAARRRQEVTHVRVALFSVLAPCILVAVACAWQPASRAAVLYAVGLFMAWTIRLGKVEEPPAREAARWREALDCEAFDLPWNGSLAGERPQTPAQPAAGAGSGGGPPPVEARGYPGHTDRVPLAYARLLGQLAALDWDPAAGARYRKTVGGLLAAVAIVLLAVSAAFRPSGETIFVTAFALSPIAWWFARVHGTHQRAGELAGRVGERIQSAWRSGLAGTIQPQAMTGLARGIQNDLFAYRAARPALLPWPGRKLWPAVPLGERRLDSLVADYQRATATER